MPCLESIQRETFTLPWPKGAGRWEQGVGGDSRQGCGNALLCKGITAGLSQRSVGWIPRAGRLWTLGEDKEAEDAAARRQEPAAQLTQLALSLHVTCPVTFPTQAPQHRRVSTTSSFPTHNPHSSGLSGLLKTNMFLFSVLVLTSRETECFLHLSI